MEEKDLGDIKNPKFWQELYIELLANPLEDKTDKQFCEEIGLSISGLNSWKNKYRKSIYNEVTKRRQQYLNEFKAIAYKELAKKMKKDTNALKMALQITGELVERSESKVEMTTDEKLRRIQTLRDGYQKRAEAWQRAGLIPKDSSSESQEPGPGASELGGA
jgi:hypothetical protein